MSKITMDNLRMMIGVINGDDLLIWGSPRLGIATFDSVDSYIGTMLNSDVTQPEMELYEKIAKTIKPFFIIWDPEETKEFILRYGIFANPGYEFVRLSSKIDNNKIELDFLKIHPDYHVYILDNAFVEMECRFINHTIFDQFGG